MRRRQFIAGLGGAAVTSIAARAQQAKLPTVGYLGVLGAKAQERWTTAFLQRMRDLDWIEGRTVSVEYRWAEGRNERMSEFAAEFVRLKVDVIVTAGTAAAIAVKQATSAVPIRLRGQYSPDRPS